jgi:lipoprotein-releasing system ATP-binding protein
MNSTPVLLCQHVSKSYVDGANSVNVLNDVSFSVNAGEKVAILGSSGSGKSTLLHILGGLEQPSSGEIVLAQQTLSRLSSSQLAVLRNNSLGFIYQFHHLLAEFTALENVAMPLLIAGVSPKEAEERAASLLNRVGLSAREKHQPAALSGGERQRVAIARALINNPALVLADEPTGNLDTKNGAHIYALLSELSEQFDTSFIVVTHDIALAKSMDRILTIQNGHLTSGDTRASTL